MLTFSEHTTLYRRIGLILFLLQLNTCFAGFPPFQAGIWVQSEPTVLVIFITSALAGLWLAAGIWRRWLVPSPNLPPMLWYFVAWIGWQCFITGLATVPWRSWFGPPQTGDGTAMCLAVVMSMLLAIPLWQLAFERRLIMMVAAVSVTIQAALHVYYPELPGSPYMPDRWLTAQWPQYLPFMGGYLWIAAFAGGYITNRKRYALLVIAMAALIAISLNKSAMGLFGVALALTTIAGWLPLPPALQHFFTPGRRWRHILMAACVLPILLVFYNPLTTSLNTDRDPTGVLRVFSRINDGIGTRLIMNQVALSAIRHEPGRLLIGSGWGTYTDDIFKYALVDGIYVFKNGVRKPNWFLVDGSSHHSHSVPLETLLSMGIVGILLWYALPILVLATMAEAQFFACAPMVVAITGLFHFWFQLPQCFPYQGLYLAALLSICTPGTRHLPAVKGRSHILAGLLACAALAVSAVLQYQSMMHADEVHEAALSASPKDYTEAWLAGDRRFGDDRWAASARFYSGYASDKAGKHEADANMLGWYTYFLHTARQAAQDPLIGAHASSMELRMEYFLFGGFEDPLFDALRHEATVAFEDATMRIAHKAPLRDDYTSSFLVNLPALTHNDREREVRILNRLLAIAPDNRGALWQLGHIYLSMPGKEDLGKRMLVKAIATHVERVYPVTDAELQATARTILQ